MIADYLILILIITGVGGLVAGLLELVGRIGYNGGRRGRTARADRRKTHRGLTENEE